MISRSLFPEETYLSNYNDFSPFQKIMKLFQYKGDSVLMIQLDKFFIQGVDLLSIGINIYKFGNLYDFELYFDSLEDDSNKIEILYDYAKKIQKECGIKKYFCGLEPATDTETQFFSHLGRGPIWPEH